MGKKFVLHDWNGCLLNDVPHRFKHGPVAIFRHYGLPDPDLMDYCQNISADFMEWYYSRGIPSTGDKKRDGDTLNAIMKARMAKAPIPPLFPETKTFLSSLEDAGLGQVLVSALAESEFRRQLEHHELEHRFLETHGGIRAKAKVFKEILDRHGIDPEDAIGVTDAMSDVRELAECGVQAILTPRGYSVPDLATYPDLIVAHDLMEAMRHILD